LQAGENFGEVESVKAVSDLYAPVSGSLTAVNDDLPDNLNWPREDPYRPGPGGRPQGQPLTPLQHR